jgi:tetratricopeptide (TPR) repeat protein
MNRIEKIYYFFEIEQFEECLDQCNLIISNKSDSIFHYYAYFYKGKVEYEFGEFEKSINSYEKSLTLNSNEDQIWVSMACALELIGEKKLALNSFIKEIRYFPKNAFGWQKLAGFLTRIKRFKLAKKIFDNVSANDEIDYTVCASEYAVALYEAGNLKEELQYYDKLRAMGYNETWIEDNYNELLSEIHRADNSC